MFCHYLEAAIFFGLSVYHGGGGVDKDGGLSQGRREKNRGRRWLKSEEGERYRERW